MNEPQQAIVDWLTMLRTCSHNNGLGQNGYAGYAYAGIGDFLLQHGVWYEPRPLPEGMRYNAPRACFGNALIYGRLMGLRYVEGYAVPHIDGIAALPVHHGWNLDADGNLIDTTWRQTGLAYFGVEFSLGRAENAIWFDDGSVLDNPASRYKLFCEPWTGEDFHLSWRRSNKIRRLMNLIS